MSGSRHVGTADAYIFYVDAKLESINIILLFELFISTEN